MKIYYIVTNSQFTLADNFFLPSVKKDNKAEICPIYYDEMGKFGNGSFRTKQYLDTLIFRNKKILEIINTNLNDTVIVSDVDIYFFKPFVSECEKLIKNLDILHMRDGIENLRPNGGFTVINCNSKTLNFYEHILHQTINSENKFYLDQDAMKDYYQNNFLNIKYDYLDQRFATMPDFSYWDKNFQKDCICVHATCSGTVLDKTNKLNKLISTYNIH